MAKKYSGGVILPTSFKLEDPQPIVDYMVVENISDLSGLTNQFVGMLTFVEEDDNLWVKKNTGWEIIGNGGGSFDQDNIFKAEYVTVTNPEFNLSTFIPALNAQTYTFSEKEIPIFIVSHSTENGLVIYRYLMTNYGKGTYGQGGIYIGSSELLYIGFEYGTPQDLMNIPTTEIIDIEGLSGMTLSEYFNVHSPAYEIRNQDEGYTIINVSDDDAEASFLFIGSGGTYGNGFSQTTPEDFQLLNNLNNTSDTIVGTYNQIKLYKDNNGLIVGKKYQITNYRTEYLIDNSETGPIEKELQTLSVVNNYAQFAIYSNPYPVGTTVYLTELPPSYTGSAYVGMSGTVQTVYGTEWYIFAGAFPEVAGAKVKFTLPRYSNEFHNKTIYDTNGKVMMKPLGVVNTEVHDGSAYSDMSSSENHAVPYETLILTANSRNSFELVAKSLEHPNDEIEYYFDDNAVVNSNGTFIKNRTGIIGKRSNDSISINKDWRVQRYRRYKMSTTQFNMLKRQESLYQVTVGATNPYIGGFDSGNHSNTAHTYSLQSVENPNFWLDFTSGGTVTNVFLSGQTTTTLDRDALMYQSVKRFSQPFNITESGLAFKDYFIIPINPDGSVSNVSTVKINSLTNTVFLKNNTSYGSAGTHYVVANQITNSTISTPSTIQSSELSTIDGLYVYDNTKIKNYNTINGMFILNISDITNHGVLINVHFGGASQVIGNTSTSTVIHITQESRISNTIFGSMRAQHTIISESHINCGMIFHLVNHMSVFKLNGYLIALKTPLTGLFNPIVDNYGTVGSVLDIRQGFYPNPNKAANTYGWYFSDIPKTRGERIYTKNNNSKSLYYKSFDSSDVETLITLATPS